MKKIFILACVWTILVSVAIVFNGGEPASVSEQATGQEASKANPSETVDKIRIFQVTTKGEIDQDVLESWTQKINKIEVYLNDNHFSLKPMTVIITTFSKLEVEKERIFIDPESSTDQDLMTLILQYQYSEYQHYGLMYGVMEAMARNCDLDFETVAIPDEAIIDAYWSSMYLSYINFREDIGNPTEVNLAKYLAVALVDYIETTQEAGYLADLIARPEGNLLEIHQLMEAWRLANKPDYVSNKEPDLTQFFHNPKENRLEYKAYNANWFINLDREDRSIGDLTNIYKSSQVFYDYMGVLYGEIERLEDKFHFAHSDLPTADIYFYNDIDDRYAGLYSGYSYVIELESVMVFSHEYIHFIDQVLKAKPKYGALGEMRAEYYSQDFFFVDDWTRKWFSGFMERIKEYDYETPGFIYPVKVIEDFTGRSLTFDQDFRLLNDLSIQVKLKAKEPLPSLYDISGPYPSYYWISLMDFLIREYGEPAVQTVMMEQKLPDGSLKTMDTVIEEWMIYLEKLGPEDFHRYY